MNLLCAATGDIALHVSPNLHSGHIDRNSVQHMSWGHEEKHGGMPVRLGETFEMVILCDPQFYKVSRKGFNMARILVPSFSDSY